MMQFRHVVGVAQCGGPIAAGESTSAVPGDQGPANTQGYGTSRAADVQGLPVATQHHWDSLAGVEVQHRREQFPCCAESLVAGDVRSVEARDDFQHRRVQR